jgi:hypothetical protein
MMARWARMGSATRRTCGSSAASPSSCACECRSSTTCTYCLNLHYQAALRYTEALTRAADTDRDAAFQRFHDALVEHFGPEEMLEIVGVVVNMNVWTPIKLAEGAMPGPADCAASAAHHRLRHRTQGGGGDPRQ